MSFFGKVKQLCQKGGIHKEEHIQFICLQKQCRNDNLCCVICKQQLHNQHKTILLKQFVDDLSWRARSFNQQNDLKIGQDLDDAQAHCLKTINNFKKYAINKLSKFEEKMLLYFQHYKQEKIEQQQVSKNNSVNLLLQQLVYEQDPSQIQSSINEILASVKITDGRIKEVPKEFLLPDQNDEAFLKFQSSLIACLKSIHLSFSEEYKRMQSALPHFLRSQTSNAEFTDEAYNTVKSTPFQNSQRAPQFPLPNQQQPQNHQISQDLKQKTEENSPGPKEASKELNFSNISQKVSMIVEDVQNQSYNPSQRRKTQQQQFIQTPNESLQLSQQLRGRDISNSSKNQSRKNSKESIRSSSVDRRLQFQFSQNLKHQFVLLGNKGQVCKASTQSNEVRLVLAEPSIDSMPQREVTWGFKIISCKNIAQTAPLAVGVCHINTAQAYRYQFQGEDLNLSQCKSMDKTLSRNNSFYTLQTEHGAYLLSANGIVRSHQDRKQDMRKSNVRFANGDTVICTYNPFKQYLKFERQGTNESCFLNLKPNLGDKLYPCVRLSYSGDTVELVNL